MGRYFVRLDPAGYYARGEHGFDYEVTGDEWLRQLVPGESTAQPWQGRDQVYSAPSNFYNPPGSPWVMCKPRQFNPDWLRDARLANHVLRKTHWTFASGVTANEFDQDALPGGTAVGANKWISIPRVPAATSLNGIPYANLAAACGGQFNLNGFVTIAKCGTTPVGGTMYGGFHPLFTWNAWPAPARPVVFGWGEFALILFRTVSYLLHSPTGDRVTWRLLSRSEAGPKRATNVLAFQPDIRSEMFMPVGLSNACLFTDGGKDPLRIALARSGESFNYWAERTDAWWIGSIAGERLSFQAQVVGYEIADSTPSGGSTPATHFDLGSYRPTGAAQHRASVALWETPGAGISIAEGTATRTYTSASQNQTVVSGVRDASYNPWVSSGLISRGSLHLRLVPGNAGVNSAYLSPSVSHYQLQFPPSLVARSPNTVTLDDTQWRAIRFNKSLRDPQGNKIEVDLFDAGVGLLSSLGFHRRVNYPIEILEDTTGDGTPDTVRLAGWVATPGLRLLQQTGALRPEGGTLADPLQEYHLTARGLLSRMDERWLYLPQMTNPATPGFVEHTYAVARSLLMSGVDTSDSARVVIATDPWAGTDIARLPGTWAYQTGQFDVKVDSDWAPDWDETRWQYVRKISEQWSGWVLYETLAGLARYHPDLQIETSMRSVVPYYLSGTLYASEAEAVAAGYPHQKYEAGAERAFDWPKANVVRVSGTDTQGGLVSHIIDRWTPSIDDPADEDYLGEERLEPKVSTLAVTRLAMGKMARLILHRLRRAREDWPVVLPKMAPWEVGPNPLDLGTVFAFSEITGAFLIVHLEGEIRSSRLTSGSTRSIVRTTATGERLPLINSSSNTAGGYPGVGA